MKLWLNRPLPAAEDPRVRLVLLQHMTRDNDALLHLTAEWCETSETVHLILYDLYWMRTVLSKISFSSSDPNSALKRWRNQEGSLQLHGLISDVCTVMLTQSDRWNPQWTRAELAFLFFRAIKPELMFYPKLFVVGQQLSRISFTSNASIQCQRRKQYALYTGSLGWWTVQWVWPSARDQNSLLISVQTSLFYNDYNLSLTLAFTHMALTTTSEYRLDVEY